jgi:hypothetical protein
MDNVGPKRALFLVKESIFIYNQKMKFVEDSKINELLTNSTKKINKINGLFDLITLQNDSNKKKKSNSNDIIKCFAKAFICFFKNYASLCEDDFITNENKISMYECFDDEEKVKTIKDLLDFLFIKFDLTMDSIFGYEKILIENK